MRAMLVRQRLVRTAAAAASVALIAACGVKANGTNGGATPTASAVAYSAGMMAVSNGTDTVDIAERKVTFPTTVRDAAWSPDGSRLAFVDRDGNIATAHPDGNGLIVLTQQKSGVVRSRPIWSGAEVVFAEKDAKGKSQVLAVYANAGAYLPWGATEVKQGERVAAMGGPEEPVYESNEFGYGDDTVPSASLTTGKGKEMAFQRKGPNGPEVWVADLNQRTPWQSKIADGSEPALSPDGLRVAYVDTNGQVEVLTTTVEKAKPVQVTFGATSPSHLTWSADGSRLAFQTPTDIETVAANVPAGTTANPSTQVSASSGVATYLLPQKDKVTKFNGADPVEISVAASQSRWPTLEVPFAGESSRPAQTVLLAGTTNLPVTLAGAQVVDRGPLLFTTGTSLDPRTATEIKRVLGKVEKGGPVPTVTILGDTDVVSTQVESAIQGFGFKTDRISGKDPYAMAVTAAGKPASSKLVFVVDANDTAAYTAAISSLGLWSEQTVLLTNGSVMPDGVKTFLNQVSKDTKIYGVGAGAQAALQTSWAGKPAKLAVTPYVGATTAATPVLLLNEYAGFAQTVVVVNASSPADVIAGIGLARGVGAPVLAIDGKGDLDGALRGWLDKSSASIDELMIVDSSAAISADVEAKLGGLVSGPLGYATTANPKTN